MRQVEFDTSGEVDKRLPSYIRLRDGLAGRIARGDWKPDVTLPSENQLAAETGLSVGTVRKAMQMLVDEGLLERRQGAGTFLSKRAFDTSLFRFFAVTTEDGTPIIPTSRLIARTRIGAPAAVSRVLGTEDCIRIDRVRSHFDQVLLSEEIWIPHHRFQGLETLAEGEIGPLLYPLYLERFSVFIANAVDDVSFARASDAVAGRLGVAPGGPTAVIERTAFTVDGTAVEWRVAQGPAERFRYRSRLT
ncbi:GntR family transcriptional regulator [Falsirhodobacter sp. 20TX0035]|uniref:GntR family transcriptional regulator n=1 Tax=Falsirhodobacter sp. 20TX0035 TaxID=3022019 RepID=UPI00232F27EE|nr:GntR family transcriptional regulator [Falsirhodobacter sp. 20TX0035]MDB6454180.1 GntR family transcriptional regulator [Falsirhodobacter sp. 20TX0035]